MNTLTKKLVSLALAIITAVAFCTNASAAYCKNWMVDRTPAKSEDRSGWTGTGNSVFSVDTNVYYKDSKYSIKIQNTDYNVAYIE